MNSGMIMFFGCGTHREEAMMRYITGNSFKNRIVGEGVLNDYMLCIQNLEHLPDDNIRDDDVHVSVRSIVRRNWGDDFKNYIAKQEPGGVVHGSIWRITEHEYAILRYWELVDFGWYKEAEVNVHSKSGDIYYCRTVCLRDEHGYAIEVQGKDYNSWLQPKYLYKKIAKESRLLFRDYIQNGGL